MFTSIKSYLSTTLFKEENNDLVQNMDESSDNNSSQNENNDSFVSGLKGKIFI